MATIVKNWTTGTGSATIEYGGQGDGQITITTDANNLYEARSMQVTVRTTDGSKSVVLGITQAARQRIDLSAAVVTAADQTYNGSAKTPTPTVTLNGSTVPSTGYDVSYSNNTNAGTATITVTGKGEYIGTATGTFTINQATGQVTIVPTARDVTYTGSSQYLVTAGSGTGTMYYRYKLSTSSSWSSWSTTRPSRTSAGTYNIEYYAAASSDGNYTQSATGSLNVEMKKAASSVSAAPTAKSLTYNTSAQALVNAGTASGGTMYYKYTTTNSKPTSTSGFSSSIPTRTTAGTYYVWYYVAGDSNHTNTAISSTSVSVTIAKASRTITGTYTPVSIYVGESKTPTFSVSAGSNDGSIVLSASNSRVSVSGSSITGISTGSCSITAQITEGTNYLSASMSWTITCMAAKRHGEHLYESLSNSVVITNTGQEVSSPVYKTTDYIPVATGERIQFRSSGSKNVYCFSGYAKQGTAYIVPSSCQTGDDDGVTNFIVDYDITIPSNVFYIRICNDMRVISNTTVDIYFV